MGELSQYAQFGDLSITLRLAAGQIYDVAISRPNKLQLLTTRLAALLRGCFPTRRAANPDNVRCPVVVPNTDVQRVEYY
jgi:hypothetical protein